jgi:hypothetical protein
VLPRRACRIAALALLVMLSLSGCVRVRAALSVSEDDLVSGDVIIATWPRGPNDQGPELKVLPELADKVHTEKYAADGYVGQKLTLSGLRFSDLTVLAESITDSKQYRLNLRRSGDLVSLSGSIDLTQVSADRLDVQLKIALPGSINRTNGLNDGGTISWKPKPGAVTEFNTTAEFSDQSGVSWTKWVAIVASSAVGVALIVLGLALLGHRRHQAQIAAERAQAS